MQRKDELQFPFQIGTGVTYWHKRDPFGVMSVASVFFEKKFSVGYNKIQYVTFKQYNKKHVHNNSKALPLVILLGLSGLRCCLL